MTVKRFCDNCGEEITTASYIKRTVKIHGTNMTAHFSHKWFRGSDGAELARPDFCEACLLGVIAGEIKQVPRRP